MGASAITHFPRSLIEFQRRFPDERACAEYLAGVRWPDGFRCPSCGQGKGWELSSKAFSPQGKMLVAGAVEVHDGGPGRVRLGAIQDASAESLHAFVRANVETGATARTDGWRGYPGAPGVTHEPHVVGPMAAHVVLPWTHRVFANLKRWALGVYHGLRRKHLQSYLDEFAFRFNRRHTRHAAFRSLLGISVAKMPTTYNMLIKPEATA